MLTPAFHFQILDDFFDTFNRNADILCQQLTLLLSDEKQENENEIEMFPLVKRCTLDIICGNCNNNVAHLNFRIMRNRVSMRNAYYH